MNFSIWLRMNVIFTIESGNIYHNLIRDVIIVILLVSFIPFFIVVSKKLFEFSIEPGKSFVTLGESSVKSLKLINQKLKFCFILEKDLLVTRASKQLKVRIWLVNNSRCAMPWKWLWWWLLHSDGFGDVDDLWMMTALLKKWNF